MHLHLQLICVQGASNERTSMCGEERDISGKEKDKNHRVKQGLQWSAVLRKALVVSFYKVLNFGENSSATNLFKFVFV